MYRLLLTSLICLGLLAPASASAWWQDDWQYRKQVSVDTTPQGAAINDSLGRLPLLVRLHTGNFTFDGVNENGSDIRFVAADDKTVLRHQVESFDPLMGMALIWVDVPRVEGGQRQDIWMYYGNAKAPESGNGQSVFDPDYTLVYHFDGAPGTPPRDSTAYANNAQTAAGSPVEGVIGRSAQLLGQPLLLPASPSLAVSAGGTFSFSGWVRPDQLAGEQVLLSRREGGNALLVGLAQGAPAVATEAASGEGEASAAAPTLQPFQGAIDELRLSKIARPAALLLADATAQGAESRLVAYGVDEKQSGFGFGKLGFLLNAVPLDAWVIIAILALMMVQSWVIMYRKNQNVGRVSRANGLFRERFAEVGTRLELLADDRELAARLQHSSLWRLYQVAVKEIRTRREQGADTSSVSAATIEAIRASMDGVRTKENQQLGSRLSSLSNAIAGGPYIGLLGTVLGIMVVFLGTAMAGDVNINAIAPGMAAALLATAMGLFVAIPALFGYNRLVTRNKEVSADMRVFVDEFVTRLAEVHGESQLSEVAHRRNGQPLPA